MQRMEQGNLSGRLSWDRLKGLTIYGIPLPLFALFSLLAIVAMYLNLLPSGMIGALLIMIVLGEWFGWIGDHTPVIRSF
ncbi:MAG: 2-hydroxycarboxylate transporter family protein, partial [Firmicutes bacterium]|nr:2-hydroxycarboxylate transporter family protein [Bacillota bacterium]